MIFVLFHDRFPQVAEDETRTIWLPEQSDLDLPFGDYSFLDMFCTEPGCDCRRVMFSVVSSIRPRDILAVVNWGWEKEKFYAKWLRESNPELVKELKGPSLNFGSPQSELAPGILKLTEQVLLRDQAFIDRIRRHYKMFRDKVERDAQSKVIPLGRDHWRSSQALPQRTKAVKVRKPLPKSPQAWLNEIADAYIEAREAIPFGRFVGQVITERDLYHMAPAVCLKFRGLKKAEKLLKKATDAALSTYVASEDLSGELLRIPQVAFALCYLAAHFGLDLIREDVVDSVMDYVEREKEVLIDKTS